MDRHLIDDLDLSLEELSAEELDYVVTAFKCSGSFRTVASWGCGTLSSGSSFSSAGN